MSKYLNSKEHLENIKKAGNLGNKKIQELKIKRIQEYNSNPNKCKNCNKFFPYNKRFNNFCNCSCSASFNNLGRKLSEKTKLKTSLSCKGKCGGYTRTGGKGKKGWYRGYWCDSSWELAWVIYHLDNNIFFERVKEKFEYIVNKEKHYYLPDFKKNGIYYEIKGYKTLLDDIKWRSVKNLKILYKKDLKEIFEYVKIKYGKNWINLYEI
jgi:hypothetical protein